MQVRDAMTAQALCCTSETTLGAAATLMAAGHCGTLPVVHGGKTVGMITDRDICLALAAAQCSPSELPVADVMSEALYVCREDEEIEEALETMVSHQVRCLPVLERQGALVGLLSIDDILAKAGDAGDGSLSEAEAVHAFLKISRRLSGPLLPPH